MKLNAFRNKDVLFSADLWTYTESTDAGGGNVKHFSFSRTIKFHAVAGAMGKVDAHFAESESDVRQLCQLYQFVGPDGVELESKGVWQVQLINPWINMWGRREGFRARLQWVGIDGG